MLQTELKSAEFLGYNLAEKCLDQAESTDPNFAANAKSKIIELLAMRGPMSGEWLVNECKLAGIVPHDDRAFGTVFSRLAKDKKIEFVDYCKRTKGHGSRGGTVWGLAK
jgi:hypothetical protein